MIILIDLNLGKILNFAQFVFYCDNIFIFSMTVEEHLAHVLTVHETLWSTSSMPRCPMCIAAASVSFLGHVNLNPAANNFIPKKELAQGQ